MTYIEWAIRIFKTKWALELTQFDLCEIVPLPFHKSIQQTWTTIFARRAIDLQLETIVEVVEAITIGIKTQLAQVEGIVVRFRCRSLVVD